MNQIKTLVAGVLAVSSFSVHAEITVTGNVIQLPDDGWYQVQSQQDYASICEGVQECTVEAGDYIVINHTSGERFSVSVPDNPTSSDISVDGNTINWPDNGWYQVQSMDTYESVCEGGRSCVVEPGSYVVINHTTAERFSDIVVTGDGETSPESEPLGMGEHREYNTGFFDRRYFLNQEVFFQDVFSYKTPLTPLFVDSTARHLERVVRQASLMEHSQNVEHEYEGSQWELTETSSQSSYTCDAGGTMTYESVVGLVNPSGESEIETGLTVEVNFSECHSVYELDENYYPYLEGDIFAFGEYTLNGTFRVELSSNSAPSRRSFRTAHHEWDNFSIKAAAPSQWSVTANGESSYGYNVTAVSVDHHYNGVYDYQITGENGDVLQQGSANNPSE